MVKRMKVKGMGYGPGLSQVGKGKLTVGNNGVIQEIPKQMGGSNQTEFNTVSSEYGQCAFGRMKGGEKAWYERPSTYLSIASPLASLVPGVGWLLAPGLAAGSALARASGNGKRRRMKK